MHRHQRNGRLSDLFGAITGRDKELYSRWARGTTAESALKHARTPFFESVKFGPKYCVHRSEEGRGEAE